MRDEAHSYLVCPAQMMANRYFKLLNLESRGLLMTLRYFCWDNETFPSDVKELELLLGIPQQQIQDNLHFLIPHFFDTAPQDQFEYCCPELDAYKASYLLKKEKMSSNGKKGAKARYGELGSTSLESSSY
jgi:hypothetical protein